MGGTKPELACNGRQRGAKQGKIRRIEHDAEKGQDEKTSMPARKRQLFQARNKLRRFCFVRDSHAFPRVKITATPEFDRHEPCRRPVPVRDSFGAVGDGDARHAIPRLVHVCMHEASIAAREARGASRRSHPLPTRDDRLASFKQTHRPATGGRSSIYEERACAKRSSAAAENTRILATRSLSPVSSVSARSTGPVTARQQCPGASP